MRSPCALATLAIVFICVHARAALSLTETDSTLTVTNDHYSVTFDKTKGGTLARLGTRDVRQADEADGYLLLNDTDPVVTATATPDQAEVKVAAYYVTDGAKAPSHIRAQYRYAFHRDSAVVGLYALISQNLVRTHADVALAPTWRKLSLLDFGAHTGEAKGFTGERIKKRLFFAPATETLFDVSAEDVAHFAELTCPMPPVTEALMPNALDDRSKWVDVSGIWDFGSGRVRATSLAFQHSWNVAGDAVWTDYLLEARARTVSGSGHVYLCARWQDPDNHYALSYLEFPAFSMRIDRVVNGRRIILAEIGEMPDLRVAPDTHIAFAVRGPLLQAFRSNELLLETYDSVFASGRVALGAAVEHPVVFTEVRIHRLEALKDPPPLVRLTSPVSRHAFYRDETEAVLPFAVSCDRAMDGLIVTFSLMNEKHLTTGELLRKAMALDTVRPGEEKAVPFLFQPTQWRSGDYTLKVTVTREDAVLAREETTISLRRRPNADRMLVNAWDSGDPELLARYGFNRVKVHHDNTMSRWIGDEYRTPDNPKRLLVPGAARRLQEIHDRFDECVKHGMWGYLQLEYTRRVAEGVEEAYALKRNGVELQLRPNHYYGAGQRRPNPWHPANIRTIQDFWRTALLAYEDMPGWQSTLLNSESEGTLDVYGNDYWLAMAREELGFDVPEDAAETYRAPKSRPPPEDGIVDADDPYYRFYRWWWERGEGQSMLHARVAEVIKEIRPDVQVWHDPALRQLFVRGRLRGLDQILHWTYSWPRPDRIPMIVDELRCAAVDGQVPVLMIQLIAWGNVAIPPNAPKWPFTKRQSFLPAHSPAVVRQVTWMAVSRGVGGVSYHGIETIDANGMKPGDDRTDVRGVGYRSYMYSNPDTLEAIREVSQTLIQPYGMLTRQLSPVKGQVAFLLSTANAALARRDPMDFKAREAGSLYTKLQAAHVPMDVVYEIDLEEKGLDAYAAIALPGCRVLPRHLYDMIHGFAERGGLIIADRQRVPQFPNVVEFPQAAATWGPGDRIQREVLDAAPQVRSALQDKIRRWVDCDSASVALSTLEDGPNRLVFVINTLKKYGEYLGIYGKVLDDGVPQQVNVKIRRTESVIYDALSQRRIEPAEDGDWFKWPVDLGPGEGRLFAVLPRAIQAVALEAPESVIKGSTVRVSVNVVDEAGAAVTGLIPLRVDIADSQGVEHDYSDYAVARDGTAEVVFPIALNEPAGHWNVKVCELYGGNCGRVFLEVEGKTAKSTAAEDAVISQKTALPSLVSIPEHWLFRIDRIKAGEAEKWFSPDWEKTDWKRISTHDFWDAAIGLYEGDAWYAIDLVIPAGGGKKMWIEFGAVDENYTLWINGKYIADNLAAGTALWDKPVAAEITGHYRPDDVNHIVVRVHNTLGAGGIWKPARIVADD